VPAEWVPPELQTRTLSWALVGQPAAWLLGMPLVGVVGEASWRYGWLALPLVAAIAAAALVAPRAGGAPAASRPAALRAVIRERSTSRWLLAELFSNTGWAGTLVFAGALLTESYRTSTGLTGCLLAVAGATYVAGNLLSRRLVRYEARRILVVLVGCIAVVDAAFGLARQDIATSSILLAVAAFLAGGRTLVSSSFALSTPPDLRPTAASLRASTMQLGYFGGSLLGGAALAAGGFGALGAAMGLCFAAAAATLVRRPPAYRPRRSPASLPALDRAQA
jgi:predicted MFS family arabinose efflux permease